MGLINGNDNGGYYSPYIENYEQGFVDNQLLPSSTDDESDTHSLTNGPAASFRQRQTQQHVSVSQENLANFGRKRLGKGVRKTRRIDNLRYLINLQEKDDDIVDNNFANFEPSSTSFEQLFDDSEKMNVWNSFVESSEEEQRRMLNYRGLHDIKEDEEDGDNVMEGQTAEDSWVMILDERSEHPAFSPKQCYGRVDRKLKNLLKRRQLPLGMLANLERELVTFFHDCSSSDSSGDSSVFVCDIDSSYERLLLHALCQYLHLHSRSYDDENGSRKTQVENRFTHFLPPSLLLSEYLQKNQHCL